jgi:hypothetical protein
MAPSQIMMKTPGGGGEDLAVAEIQGLYGPFSFPEKLLQQIWLRGDFDLSSAFTADGRRVEVLHPGRWNLLGGPDFKGARLRIGDLATNGDVELHLHASDWRAHGHAADPAYADVVLHVVLFPAGERVTAGMDGRAIPLLTLLPLLHHDLESYAADAAVERLANHPLTSAHEALAAMTQSALREELGLRAAERWRQKVHYAKIRIERLGWTEACHHTALEILGYRANRAPMLAMATRYPLTDWAKLPGDEARETFIDALLANEEGRWRWQLQGTRPANHPRARLRQYVEWTGARPDWPERLAAIAAQLPHLAFPDASEETTTAQLRKRAGFRDWRARFVDQICADALGGSRVDTLICDGFWPLMAARDPIDAEKLKTWWWHWFAGDVPARWLVLLRGLHAIGTRDWPASHGSAQGLLGWLLAEEKKQNFGDSAEGRGT